MKHFVLRVLDFAWSLLPKRLRVLFIQSRSNFGVLDASGHEILMRVESLDSLNRLQSCHKEPETIKWLDGYVRKEDVLYDVGANVGAYSLYAAKVAGAKVYSFEPSPSTFSLLLENIHLNKLGQQITPFNIPLSSTSELKTFKYNSLSAGSATHGGLEHALSSNQDISQPVLTLSLDDLIQRYNMQKPSLMKIDVDGHELGILEGATETLRDSGLRSIQIEMSSSDSTFEPIKKILAESGFRIDHVNAHPNSASTDIVFVR